MPDPPDLESAEGVRGHILFLGDRWVFRVYGPHSPGTRGPYRDHAILVHDLSVEITSGYFVLREDADGVRTLDYRPRPGKEPDRG